ncbi:MAG: MBL fold metallo-hydrolase [Candidatus Latescibacteria bacterium]|nr:MBL fold metallo-hydrolase [bacterium]MBD3424611.1 MBL fold metallo-hydrolase [Candidatus Latescibacterota bacterium]
MKKTSLKKDIYWVGGIDWDLRNFHGYLTQRGSTYNAYLIIDEKTVLVDTVKDYLFDEMLARIEQIIDPSEIDHIVSNHVEMDHSGSIPSILEHCPGAEVITSKRGEKGLRKHYGEGLNLKPVESGESINIGKRTLTFVHTPMVHWPDNMVTYINEDRILFSNDAFGQHIASAERFDDKLEWGIIREEAAKYYANIVLPYSAQVQKALEALSGLDIDMIAPSHGIIWRKNIESILEEYGKWANSETSPDKALIVYDTMWGSTGKIARALMDGMEEDGKSVTMRNLSESHISDVMTDILDSRFVLVGSPTLNNGMLPTVGKFLTYLKGLRPAKRTGISFGSYGWGGQAPGEIEDILKDIGWDLPVEKIRVNYIPEPEDLERIREAGKELVNSIEEGQ